MKTAILMISLCASLLVLCVGSIGQSENTQNDPVLRSGAPRQSPESPPQFNIDRKTGQVQSQITAGSAQKVPAPVTGARGTTTANSPNQDDNPLLPQAPPDWASDPATKQKYLASLQGYYDYRRLGYQHRQGDFTWQHYSTVVIFISVLALVFSGMYFAYVQFHADLRLKAQPGPSVPGEKSEVELSVKGFRVSSPVLGVIILAVSLAFFYLYLVYVYPISDAL